MSHLSKPSRRVISVFISFILVLLACPSLSAQALLKAAYDGDLGTVQRLVLSHPEAVNQTDDMGLTALHWAAGLGRRDVVQFLLEHKAIVDARDRRGARTMRSWAEKQSDHTRNPGDPGGDFAMAASLPDHDAPPDSCTPLHWAASAGHADVVDLLLAHGASVNAANVDGETPLHYAAHYGHPDVVALLLKHGAIVDVPDSLGRTALYAASWCDSYRYRADVMRLLISAGADAKRTTKDGDDALIMAADHANADAIEILLRAGANPNIIDHYGHSALSEAAGRTPSAPSVRLLLRAGADPNITDSMNHSTPLLELGLGGNEALHLLVEAGARADVRDRSGRTALHATVGFATASDITYLIRHGADPKAVDYQGSTALHEIVMAWDPHPGVVAALVKGGADVNARDNRGSTPLLLAARADRYSLTEALLKSGASVDVRDGDGKTPLDYARGHNDEKMIKLLRKFGGK